MARAVKITISISLAVLAVVFLFHFMRPGPLAMLVERGVPVPENVRVTNSEHGGSFAQYLFVRLELDKDSLKKYRQDLPAGRPLNAPSGIRVVKDDLSDSEMMKLIDEKIRFKHVVNGGYLPWWEIDRITYGTHHEKELANACRYEIYIDDDNSVVYIYWHHS